MRPPCKFFGTPRGCNKGDRCTFAHDGSAAPRQTDSTSRARGRGAGPPSGGRDVAYGGRGAAYGNDTFRDILTELGCRADPQPGLVQRWVQLALQRCERGSASQVLQQLRKDDGQNLLRAAALQISQAGARAALLGVLLPLMRVLTHEDVRTDPTQANPVLSTLHDALSLADLSTRLEELSTDPAADGEGFIRQQLQQLGGMAMPCLPKDWLDVLQPTTTYLQEATTRFNMQNSPAALEGAKALLNSLAAAFSKHLAAEGSVARRRSTECRRLLASLQLLQRQLHAQEDASKKVEQLQAMQARYEAWQKQQGSVAAAGGGASSPGPGELHPSGPRHDNDKINHLEISVAPTRDEVLCTKRPFLPPNRPGSLPHAAHDPDRAHRELHFRLLRHDVVGPVSDAAQAFRQFGGVAGLKSLKNQTPGFSVRLHLKAGRDVQDMYVFRNVAILGLTSNYNGSIAYQIEFDDAPQLANASLERRRDWWQHTKQLQHGSLVALWWDGDSSSSGGGMAGSSTQGAALPNVMFATVSERDEKQLAAQGEPRKRPQLGIRMCGKPVTAELMAAVLGRQRLGGKKEVVLLPAAGGYFSYTPILTALQSTQPLPLARYILYGQGTAGASTPQVPVLLHGELVGGAGDGAAGPVQVPAYAAGATCVYDFKPVLSQEKIKELSTEDLQRLGRICVSSPDGIPQDLLLRATTLDPSQAAALCACLTKELAVVQGPPGCGKTYIGVQLVRLLLANTRSSSSHSGPEVISSTIPASLRPEIGPILVLCYTNHALDAFLLDLVECGIDEGIIRVGRRSSCPQLDKYNLRNQEGGLARGPEVGKCRARVEELKSEVNNRLERVQASRTARRLQWSDVQQSLEHSQPALLDSFLMRASIMDQASFLQAAAAGDDFDDEGFLQAKPRRRGGTRRQHKQAMGSDWVWGADPLQDWLNSSPVWDWQRQQWMLHSMQQWEAAANGNYDDSSSTAAADANPGASSSSSSSAVNARGRGNTGAEPQPGAAKSTKASSSNAFSILAGFGDDADDTDDPDVLLARLEAEGAISQASSTAVMSATNSSEGAFMQATDSTDAAGAAAGAGLFAQPVGGFGEWMLLPGGDQPGAAAAAAAGEAAAADAADSASDDGWEVAGLSDSDAGADDATSSTGPPTDTSASATPQPAPPPSPAAAAVQEEHSQGDAASSATTSSRQPSTSDAAAAAAEEDNTAGVASDQVDIPLEVQEMEDLDRPVEELLLLDDVSVMSRSERRKLYEHWLSNLANQWGADIDSLIVELQEQQKQLQALYDRAALQVLRGARIVGMTTTGLANQQGLLHGLQPKVVIVEEAAEVLEAHILTSLTPTVEHLVLIGDHFQLPPKVEVYELQKESGRGYDLNKSMFERLVEANTVQHVTLQQQRRMRPAISELIRGPLYPELRDHPAVLSYPHVKGMVHDLFFWDHGHKEGGTDQSKSRFNEHEVQACMGLARYLLQQGYGGKEQPDICILTPYVGQLMKLRQAVAAVSSFKIVMNDRDQKDLENVMTDAAMADSPFSTTPDTTTASSVSGSDPLQTAQSGDAAGSAANPALLAGAGSKVVTLGRSLRLATIDNFQGEEARIIILSLVRNPREEGAGIGFLAVNNRINVLLSRAKEGMYLVGSSAALYAAAEKSVAAGRPCMWAPVLDQLAADGRLGSSLQVCCQRHGNITDINNPREFAQLVGDGGCQQACGLKLPCGHICPRRCHADDPLHSQTKCLKPCGKLCARGRHPCERLCHEPCTACTALEELVELPCGHTASNVPCCKADDPGKIRCSQMVTVTVPGCSHQLTVPCGSSQGYRAGTTPCTQEVLVTLPGCGHTLKLPCGKAALAMLDPTTCREACGGLLQGCEHVCSSKCGACMQKLLDSSSSSTSGAAAEQRGFLQAFLSNVQVNMPELYRIWSDWCDENAAGVQSQQQHQRWLRFLRDALAPALGSRQCQELSTTASADASSSAMSWPDYFSSCRSLGSGKSAHERLAAEWQAALQETTTTTTTSSSLGPWQKPHLPCNKTCDKPLACGHSCLQKCHQGSNCGPCRQSCSIHCEHATCSLQCAAPCAPCAEPCGWHCEHKGACLLPCGVPCDREPCNMRCSKLLECGHRCPGLCGEVCLPRKFCVHAECMGKAPQSVKSRVVDILLFRTFGELTEADASADPLVLLPCGHLFLTSTLDGHMEMSGAYARSSSNDPSNGSGTEAGHPSSTAAAADASSTTQSDLEPWGGPLHRNDFPPPKSCPDCRRVVTGVRRYGRVVLHSQLGVIQRKHAQAIRVCLTNSRTQLTELQASVLSPAAAWRDNASLAGAELLISRKKPLAAGLLTELDTGRREAWNTGLRFTQLVAAAQRTPKQYVFSAHQAAIMTAAQDGRLAPAAARARLKALRRSQGKHDQQLAFEAVQSHASAMQLCLALDRQQLEALGAGLEALQHALDRELLGEDLGYDVMPRERSTGARRAALWLAEQKRDLQAHVCRITGQAAALYHGAAREIQGAIAAAAKDACFTASYQLSHSLMLLIVERATQLQPLKRPSLARLLAATHRPPQNAQAAPEPSSAAGRHEQQLRELQLKLLEQAEGVGNAAVQLFSAQKLQLLAKAGDDPAGLQFVHAMRNDAITAIQDLLKKLPGIKEELRGDLDAAEVAAILAALMQAEGRYYSGIGLQSFMAGHLYECPNGHLFVIGECGQAMQESRCDRCGAVIGGSSHRLNAHNRQASQAVQRAVAAAAGGVM